MAYYNKIGLLIFSKDRSKFLAVRKYKKNVTDDYIMPGGKFEEDTKEETIVNEIQEELNSRVDLETLKYIGEYEDTAAGRPDRRVSIKLYECELLDEPTPSTEIESIHWIDSSYINYEEVSPIIRNKIIPDLLERNLIS